MICPSTKSTIGDRSVTILTQNPHDDRVDIKGVVLRFCYHNIGDGLVRDVLFLTTVTIEAAQARLAELIENLPFGEQIVITLAIDVRSLGRRRSAGKRQGDTYDPDG